MVLRDFYRRFSLDESLAEVVGHNPYYRTIDSGLNGKLRKNALYCGLVIDYVRLPL